MQTITVEGGFWTRFPEGAVVTMLLKGMDNHPKAETENLYRQLLLEGKKAALTHLTEDAFSDNVVITDWRSAYSTFKTKKGARSSIEALLKRADQDRDFNPINPLVDLYNHISLSFATPVGAEDVDKITGTLRLTETAGGDAFRPLGSDKDEPTLPGEIAWLDDDGAVCRCLNWREAERTMLTDHTQNAVVIMEATTPAQVSQAQKAMAALNDLCQVHLGVTGKIVTLTAQTPSVTLN